MTGRKSQGDQGGSSSGYVATRVLLVTVDFALILIALVMYAQSDIWGYAFYGTLCTVIVHAPILLRIVPALSMWGVLAFVVTIGAGVRGLAIGAGYPDENTLNHLFTRGVPFSDLVPEALLTVACVLLLTMGFSATVSRRKGDQGPVSDEAPAGLTATSVPTAVFATLIGAYALAGAVGTSLYYGAVGGAAASISERRTTYTGSTEYASHGVVQFLAGAGVVALLLFLAWRLALRKKWTPATWVVLGVLSINAFAINWVTTTRADLLYVSFGVLLVVALVSGRLSSRLVVTLACVVILGIGVLSQTRSSGGEQQSLESISIGVGVDSGLLNRNAFDLSKTLHISSAVPETLPLEYGGTVASYIFAPVPREVWPEKPVVSPGPTIGQKIYGLPQTGVPPGMVGELVWNFGRVPAAFLAGLAGVVLGLLQRWCAGWDSRRVSLVLVHATVLLPFGKAVMGVAMGQALSAAGQAFVLLLPLVLLDRQLVRSAVKRRPRRRSHRPAGTALPDELRLGSGTAGPGG